MKKNKSITIIGSGNTATHLRKALLEANYKVLQVKGRSNLKKINKTADIYFIAVKDDAIENVVKQLQLKDKILLHTSGSVSIDILKKSSKNIGVLYPLQTLSKDKAINFRNVPLFIEGNNKEVLKELVVLSKKISNNIHIIKSKQRQILHLAAVFACNFSNHMYSLAAQILKRGEIPFNVLVPLIDETANKIHNGSPAEMQTGPAIRNDKKVIKNHLKLLNTDKRLKNIYALLTKSIQKQPS